jgi:hypothetical protein
MISLGLRQCPYTEVFLPPSFKDRSTSDGSKPSSNETLENSTWDTEKAI